MYEVLSPAGKSIIGAAPVRRSLPDLNGKTICEVTNGQFRSNFTFPIIRELLKKRYPDIKIIPHDEFPVQLVSLNSEEILERVKTTITLLLEKGCDAVITGNGG
jgi:hypothetical protein